MKLFGGTVLKKHCDFSPAAFALRLIIFAPFWVSEFLPMIIHYNLVVTNEYIEYLNSLTVFVFPACTCMPCRSSRVEQVKITVSRYDFACLPACLPVCN